MQNIPKNIRERIAELGKLSSHLDELRAAELGRSMAEAVTKQLLKGCNPSLALEIYEARIISETSMPKSASAAHQFQKGNASDFLQRFDVADHYKNW